MPSAWQIICMSTLSTDICTALSVNRIQSIHISLPMIAQSTRQSDAASRTKRKKYTAYKIYIDMQKDRQTCCIKYIYNMYIVYLSLHMYAYTHIYIYKYIFIYQYPQTIFLQANDGQCKYNKHMDKCILQTSVQKYDRV